jgi:hypothetical protein
MAVASSSDLSDASEQGTIMAIKYLDGNWYGSGSIGPTPPTSAPTEQTNMYSQQGYYSSSYYSFAGVAALVIGAMAVALRKNYRRPKIIISDTVTNEPQRPVTLLS